MNLDLSDDQHLMRDSFARVLNEQSSMARVRAALPSGFDPVLWGALAELGAFGMRVPEAAGGVGLGLMDAAVLMEEAGRTLASGPIAETLVAARLLASFDTAACRELLERVIAGTSVATIALRDVSEEPVQWVAGGAVAEAVIARAGDEIVLLTVPPAACGAEPN